MAGHPCGPGRIVNSNQIYGLYQQLLIPRIIGAEEPTSPLLYRQWRLRINTQSFHFTLCLFSTLSLTSLLNPQVRYVTDIESVEITETL
jgi:hypothetical protein